jgi:uncharacterized membrane protein
MDGVLIAHITAGTIAVLTGATALISRKGARVHRAAGKVFVFAMAGMGVTAAIVGARDPSNAVAAVLVIYFVGTAWLTVWRGERRGRRVELCAFVMATTVAGLGFWSAYLIATGAREAANPYILYASLFVNSAIALAALGDLTVVLRGGVNGGHRLARHLWRMCFALFIAVGSFAAQGLKALPAILPAPQVLLAAILLVLFTMAYWLVRVLFTKWARTANVPA